MTNEQKERERERETGVRKKSAYVIRTCARVLLLRIINCWPFFSKDLSSRQSVAYTTTLATRAAPPPLLSTTGSGAHFQPDRSNERAFCSLHSTPLLHCSG